MTTTPRWHWWLSLALLALCGGVATVFLGAQQALTVLPRPAEDRNVLRVAYTQTLLPDPNRRTLPITTQNQFTLSLWEPLVECDPATGELRFAFIHGNWSLDNSRPDGRWCGLNNELILLRELGCYADFTLPSAPSDTQACVLAFNRNPNGILLFTRVFLTGQTANCSSPATNEGGFTTVLLQAPLATNPASTTPGGSLPAAFYQGGKWLDFNHITDVAALPLADFNVNVGKGAPNTNLTGSKANYIKAKCTSRSGLGSPAKKWVMRTIFKYTTWTPVEQVVNSKYPATGGCT